MSESDSGGLVDNWDRTQRLIIGSVLMTLTLIGFLDRIDWRGIVSFVFQAELLFTGLLGWCPIYWACRTRKER